MVFVVAAVCGAAGVAFAATDGAALVVGTVVVGAVVVGTVAADGGAAVDVLFAVAAGVLFGAFEATDESAALFACIATA